MTKMECSNVVGEEISPMQKCLNLISHFSNDELRALSRKMEEEKTARIEKEKKEAIQATIEALTKLSNYYVYLTVEEDEYYLCDIIKVLKDILKTY